jgi:hypothetical protein
MKNPVENNTIENKIIIQQSKKGKTILMTREIQRLLKISDIIDINVALENLKQYNIGKDMLKKFIKKHNKQLEDGAKK